MVLCERAKKRGSAGKKIKGAAYKKTHTPANTVDGHLFGFQISFGGNDYRRREISRKKLSWAFRVSIAVE